MILESTNPERVIDKTKPLSKFPPIFRQGSLMEGRFFIQKDGVFAGANTSVTFSLKAVGSMCLRIANELEGVWV